MAAATPTHYRGGYENQFVTTPPEWLVCKICHYPSRKACLSKCCGKIFCKSCSEAVQTDSNTCPVCNNKGFFTNTHKQAEQVVSILQVFCLNKEKGCLWDGKVSDIASHLENSDGCPFEEVACPNDCGTRTQRQYLTNHVEDECVRRTVQCQYCQITGEHQFINDEHEALCPKFLVPCPKKAQKAYREPTHMVERDSERKIAEQESYLAQQTVNMRLLEKYMGKETILHFIDIHTSAEKLSSCEEIVPVIVKMSDYTTNKRDWFSDPFYTHPNGYKMCLYCYAGSTHLSVHLYLMKGPYDDHLRWPLKGHCEVKLLNQVSNVEHYVGTGNYDTNSHVRVTRVEKRSVWYSDQFFINKKLVVVARTCQYLKDDNIFLQVDYTVE